MSILSFLPAGAVAARTRFLFQQAAKRACARCGHATGMAGPSLNYAELLTEEIKGGVFSNRTNSTEQPHQTTDVLSATEVYHNPRGNIGINFLIMVSHPASSRKSIVDHAFSRWPIEFQAASLNCRDSEQYELIHLNFNRLFQFEIELRLGWDRDVPVAGKRGSSRPRARSSARADRSTLSSSG